MNRGKTSLIIIFILLFSQYAFLLIPLGYASPDTATFYPSNYNLWGSTSYVSGSLTDLQSDNGFYMQFRSYVSGTSTTAKTDAFIAYRDSTTSTSTPKERTWTGESTTWGGQTELATAGSPVRWVRTAYSPISTRSTEKIVVTLSDDGYLDAYVWNGTSWAVTNNIGNVSVTAAAYKCFDIAYEKTSGEAILVYSVWSTNEAQDLAYKTWIYGTGWSAEQYINDTGHTADIQYYWVSMASNPTSGSNEITMVAVDFTDADGNGWVWSGSAWGSIYELDATVSITTKECIAVAYEMTSDRAWTAVGSGTNASTFSMRSQTAGTWNVTKESPNIAAVPNWVTLKADPSSNKVMLVSVDASKDLNIVYYTGSGSWTVNGGSPAFTEDAVVDTISQRCADFAWEPTGSKGLIVWGTTAAKIKYQPFNGTGWGTATEPAMGANVHPWVQLRGNTRSITGDVKILGIVMEDTVYDLIGIKWDGTTFTGNITISSDTTAITYECFEMEFNNFGDPTQFTSEVEFLGTSNTESWTQLVWTIDSAWTIANVSVTLQLYNYTLGDYPTSGNGYISYTSSGTPNTDETQSQTITTNPTNFRDASGNWKMNITGAKSTSTEFDWKGDLVKIEVTWIAGEFYSCQANQTLIASHDVGRNGTLQRGINQDSFLEDLVSRFFSPFRGVSQAITLLTDTISGLIFPRTITQSLTLGTDVLTSKTFGRVASKALAVLTAVTKQLSLVRTTSQPVLASTLTKGALSLLRSINQALTPLLSTERVWTAIRESQQTASSSIEASKIFTGFRGISQQLSSFFDVSRYVSFSRGVSGSITLSALVEGARAFFKTVQQSLAVLTDTSRLYTSVRQLVQSLTSSLSAVRQLTFGRTVAEGLALNSLAEGFRAFFKTASQTLTFNTVSEQVSTLIRQATQKVTFLHSLIRTTTFQRITETIINIPQTVASLKAFFVDVAEQLNVYSQAILTSSFFRTATKSVLISPATESFRTFLKNISETLALSLSGTRTLTAVREFAQTLVPGTEISASKFFSKLASQTLTFLTSVTKQLSLIRATSQPILASLSAIRQLTLGRTLTESITISTFTWGARTFFKEAQQTLAMFSETFKSIFPIREIPQTITILHLTERQTVFGRTVAQSLSLSTLAEGFRIFIQNVSQTLTLLADTFSERIAISIRQATQSITISHLATRATVLNRFIEQILSFLHTAVGPIAPLPPPPPPPPPPPLYERSVAQSITILHLATRTLTALREFAQTITSIVGSIAAPPPLPSLYERSVAQSITLTVQVSTLKTFIRTVLHDIRDLILRNLPLILIITSSITIAITLYFIHTRPFTIPKLKIGAAKLLSKLKFKTSKLVSKLTFETSKLRFETPKLMSKLRFKLFKLKSKLAFKLSKLKLKLSKLLSKLKSL